MLFCCFFSSGLSKLKSSVEKPYDYCTGWRIFGMFKKKLLRVRGQCTRTESNTLNCNKQNRKVYFIEAENPPSSKTRHF